MIRAKMLIYGVVQGVGYRAFVSSVAHDLKINGKVKNLLDGSVEVVCECPDQATISKFIKLIFRKDGFIDVEKIDIVEKNEIHKPMFTWFYIDH